MSTTVVDVTNSNNEINVSLGKEGSSNIVFLLYSETTDKTINNNLGSAEYSYYFVRESFYRLIQKHHTCEIVEHPVSDVNRICAQYEAKGKNCVFLSFAPPHRSFTGFRCPSIPVFAWEFDAIPTEVWDGDPRHDWRNVLRKFGQAITHSQFSAEAVARAMGPDFPIASLPAPIWDTCRRAATDQPVEPEGRIDLKLHTALDSANLAAFVWTGESLHAPLHKPRGVVHRIKRSIMKRIVRYFGDGIAPSHPFLPSLATQVCFGGHEIVFTSVFNPYDGRKNWQDMLTAFCSACVDFPDATLVLKLVCTFPTIAMEDIKSWVRRLPPHQCRIVVIADFLAEADYNALIRATTFAVNTSMGEGQCLPLMEFMAKGKPAVAPRHTSMAEYIDEHSAFIIKTSPELCAWPHDPRAALRTHRYRIDWTSAKQAYLHAYNLAKTQPRQYQAMSREAVARLQSFCSEEVVYEGLMKLVTHAFDREGLIRALESAGSASASRRVGGSAKKGLIPPRSPLCLGRAVLPQPSDEQAQRDPILEQHNARHPQMVERNDDEVGLRDMSLGGWFNSETGELAPGFNILRGETVLDVGCGNGFLSHFCAQRGARLLLADIDGDALLAAAERLKGLNCESLELVQTNADPLPFPDASVDKVIASEVLEHVSNPDQFINELFRVAKPGATFLVSVPGALSETLQKDLAPDSDFLPPNHLRIFQVGELASLLRRHGLVVEGEYPRGFLISMWWIFFWAAGQKELRPPWQPLLRSWDRTWAMLLDQPGGLKVKRVLDEFMPKSITVIARKP